MKLKFSFLDNILDFSKNNIFTIEIHNKKYLYRLLSIFYNLSIGIFCDEINAFDINNDSINLVNDILFISNPLELSFNSRKQLNELYKYIENEISDEEKKEILKDYEKMSNFINKKISKINLPVECNMDINIKNIMKLVNINIIPKDTLVDNLLLLIDIESVFKLNKLICFINLKQYLTRNELNELYKYAVYNDIKIVDIEAGLCENKSDYESLLVIDENLNEFMV